MEYLRIPDFEALESASVDERIVQPLVGLSSGATGCTVSYIRTPPGGGSPEGRHKHAEDQIFYIVTGTMSIEVAGETFDAPPGSTVLFPAGVPHRNWNAGPEPTVHLNIIAPAPNPSVPFAIPVD